MLFYLKKGNNQFYFPETHIEGRVETKRAVSRGASH